MAKGKRFTDVKESTNPSEDVRNSVGEESGNLGFITKERVLVVFIVLLLCALGGLGYLYKKEKDTVQDPTQAATEEATKIKDSAGKLMLLPEDVEPQIATITDIDKLREENPEFYKNAENGDNLLIYPQKAIIYSPSRNIIVNVAPIIRQPAGDSVKPETEPKKPPEEEKIEESTTEPLTVELRNGTTQAGLAETYESQIKENLGENFKVVKKGNATMGGIYTGIVVYDLTGGKKGGTVKALADGLSATIETTLPTGEISSDAEVVVIIGS